MKSVAITLPDGSQKYHPAGVTPQAIAAEIGKRLEADSVAARVNGTLVDVSYRIDKDCALALITRGSPEGLEVLRHSTAHLLAQAVKELYPETQITIGPVTEEGFYYDFDRPTKFTPEDLDQIEKKMEEIASRHLNVTRHEMTKDDAILIFKNLRENYKVEMIQDISEDLVSLYQQGEWKDLCRGPHVPNTSKLGKCKLLSIAGAYWRGNENNKMLQRIYGTAFATQKELEEHLKLLEEAKKRDHRKLGPELGLFTFLPIAPAMPFYLPKGAILFDLLTGFMKEQTRKEYQQVICPQLMVTSLWKMSGHLDHYKENMFFADSNEGTTFALKPMNCPGHAALFAATRRSYRELPLRMAEFTRVHRNERGGTTHGIMRVRGFSQDDGHIFCTEEQIRDEALAMIEQTHRVYRMFGFDRVSVKLSTRGPEFLGSPQNWEKATHALEQSLSTADKQYSVAQGEAAFYGPKIDFHILDSLGRSWQCGTIQVDFSLPERFQLEYVDTSGNLNRPVMIHRAILGSFERFIGILIEHHAGHFPVWISPTQVMILNVTDAQAPYCKKLALTLETWGVRVEMDLRNEKLNYKIREAQITRTPLMLVIGNKELENQTVSVRKNNGETLGDLTLEDFQKFLWPQLKPDTGSN